MSWLSNNIYSDRFGFTAVNVRITLVRAGPGIAVQPYNGLINNSLLYWIAKQKV